MNLRHFWIAVINVDKFRRRCRRVDSVQGERERFLRILDFVRLPLRPQRIAVEHFLVVIPRRRTPEWL